jgi:Zn finger protein HypA/HybF involved in hydrogenase expression
VGYVEPDAFRFCFDEASEGSIAEGAWLDLETVPSRGRLSFVDRLRSANRKAVLQIGNRPQQQQRFS